MNIKQFRYGADNLGYLVYGSKTAMVIDGGATDEILAFIRDRHLDLRYVANTHSHMDHTIGNTALLNYPGTTCLDRKTLLEKGEVDIDGESIRVFETPGHTSGCVSFYFDGVLITGDTLFNGKIGRCFTGDLRTFLTSIKTILAFPETTLIYAGHDYVEEYMDFARRLEPGNPHIDPYLKQYDPAHVCSTLADEMKVDPFLRFNDEKIVAILNEKKLPTGTEFERWQSLISLM
ncbi:MAG: MBL fold metallo-hydrolase [Deltaproteobacteria bacterium]|nr:MBL fold metallo-hydrolase [Deltaproteobacteria bacterium]